MATLGNAICGFGAMYVATFARGPYTADKFSQFISQHPLDVAAYLIFLAMVFDALDGRLARFARHTTDFGGQLDSLADVVSFGAAPAFISLFVAHSVTAQSGRHGDAAHLGCRGTLLFVRRDSTGAVQCQQ